MVRAVSPSLGLALEGCQEVGECLPQPPDEGQRPLSTLHSVQPGAVHPRPPRGVLNTYGSIPYLLLVITN